MSYVEKTIITAILKRLNSLKYCVDSCGKFDRFAARLMNGRPAHIIRGSNGPPITVCFMNTDVEICTPRVDPGEYWRGRFDTYHIDLCDSRAMMVIFRAIDDGVVAIDKINRRTY